ncbi:MAG: hypothetical protein JXR88_18785 [Clostridia bacterium]|nr:hypothetical protein [Clostridia bacterium]
MILEKWILPVNLIMLLIILMTIAIFLTGIRKVQKSLLKLVLGFLTTAFVVWMALFTIYQNIIGLSFKNEFKNILHILGWILLILLVVVIWMLFRNRKTYFMPNYETAFKKTDELIALFDLDKKLIEVNHPHVYDQLFGVRSLTAVEHMMDRYELWQFRIIEVADGVGWILLGHDLSEIKNLELKIDEENRILEEGNKEIHEQMGIEATLESEKTRIKVIEEIQVMLIERLEKSIVDIQECLEQKVINPDEIKALSTQLREIYQEVRKSVNHIAGKE